MAAKHVWLLPAALFIGMSSGPALAAPSGSCIAWTPEARYETPHFQIHYDLTGPDAVAPTDTGKSVTRSDGMVIGYAKAGNGIPDYVEEAAVGLEYTWETYRAAGLRVPQSQAVFLKDGLGAYGLYLPECHDIYLEPDLVGVTRTGAHELAHAVQYQYWDLSDFAAIPGPEQAFYKEASADAMMIQVMLPSPYVSWFDSPDARYLLEAGTGAAFFWLYYGERFGTAVPDQDLLPGLTGMARYLELVAEPDLDLRDALELLPTSRDLLLDDVMEELVVANLLEDLISHADPISHPEITDYSYVFSQVRGFYNKVQAPVLGAASVATLVPGGLGHLRAVSIEGQVDHLWNADYLEIDRSLYDQGALIRARLDTGGLPGVATLVVVCMSGDDVTLLSTRRLEDGWEARLPVPADPSARVFVVSQSMANNGAFTYRVDLDIASR